MFPTPDLRHHWLRPVQCQAITWNNIDLLSYCQLDPSGTNFREIWTKIVSFLWNPHKKHSIAQLWGWGMECFLTHWGRVTHICVGNLTVIGPDNGLSPDRRQAIVWTNAEILLIGPLGTNLSEILIKIYPFSFTKMHLNMSPRKCRPFCLASMC